MARIGVFICHCGENIAGTVDVAAVTQTAARLPGVAHAEDYGYMCSDPGQKRLIEAIREKGLTGVVVAACSPAMHEMTFRGAAVEGGLNPFLSEMANIREQCSWVHQDRREATSKASDLVRLMVEKVKRNRALSPIRVPVTKRALVIGGGIAGIQAALDLANGGHEVVLLEREASIGGHMARLSETFPTLDCSQCILTPRMVEVSRHPNIRLFTYSELEDVSGYVGNFRVRIRHKPRYVLEDKCTNCGDCAAVCPQVVASEFDRGLSWRKAIYIPSPQAVPAVYTLDEDACLGLHPLVCEKCFQACEAKAIDLNMKPVVTELDVGAIVVATGYDMFAAEQARELGWGRFPDVVTGLELERLLSASGPTSGTVRRPSDGQVPREVVFVQCVGSRDPELGVPYCSKICCMYTAKHAMLFKHKVPEGQAYVFYMDVRAGGKGYEEFYNRAVEEDRVLYVRGRVSKVFEENGKLKVWGADTLTGQPVEIDADMVVLATAMVPNTGHRVLAQNLRAVSDEHGFYQEAHPKLRPVETLTAGVYLAGAVQAPKDIPETVAQASAAASKVQALFSRDELEREPVVAQVYEATCEGCFDCERVCPYGAISRKEISDPQGKVVRRVSSVNAGVCEGCGACVVACRNQSVELAGYSNEQIHSEIVALWPASSVRVDAEAELQHV
jgi:heterodisulfide reductase subunit A